MRVIVTGAAGFIGYHVSSLLLSQGEEVLGLDNLNDYYDVRLKEYRLSKLKVKEGFSFIKVDLAEKENVDKIFKEYKPERVVHLAAQAGVRYSLENPHAYTHSNIDGFLNILEGCRHHHVSRLVYASSSSVYGGIKEFPFHEKMDVGSPISIYAATKRANELMAYSYHHLYGFETVGLRFFTVYGPMGRPDMAIWLFTDAILNGRAIKVFNSGQMKRDFTYVDDIADGVVASTFKKLKRGDEIFNLGNNHSEELGRMIGLLEENLGQKAKRENLPMQPGDVPETSANVEHAKEDLDFDPKTRIDEGVSHFISWYKNEWLAHLEELK